MDAFLNRRSELDFDVRARMADQIFQRLSQNSVSLPNNILSAEKILEGLAYETPSHRRIRLIPA